jgi:hypothetical protein
MEEHETSFGLHRDFAHIFDHPSAADGRDQTPNDRVEANSRRPRHVLAGLRFLGKAVNQETARCVFHILCRCDAAASKQPEASMARKVLQKWFVG